MYICANTYRRIFLPCRRRNQVPLKRSQLSTPHSITTQGTAIWTLAVTGNPYFAERLTKYLMVSSRSLKIPDLYIQGRPDGICWTFTQSVRILFANLRRNVYSCKDKWDYRCSENVDCEVTTCKNALRHNTDNSKSSSYLESIECSVYNSNNIFSSIAITFQG